MPQMVRRNANICANGFIHQCIAIMLVFPGKQSLTFVVETVDDETYLRGAT